MVRRVEMVFAPEGARDLGEKERYRSEQARLEQEVQLLVEEDWV
jgi:hypothetical protein